MRVLTAAPFILLLSCLFTCTAQPSPYEDGTGELSAAALAINNSYMGALFAHNPPHGADARTLRGGPREERLFEKTSQELGMELVPSRGSGLRDKAAATKTARESNSAWGEPANVYGVAFEWSDVSV